VAQNERDTPRLLGEQIPITGATYEESARIAAAEALRFIEEAIAATDPSGVEILYEQAAEELKRAAEYVKAIQSGDADRLGGLS
jgi:hypothetical protein